MLGERLDRALGAVAWHVAEADHRIALQDGLELVERATPSERAAAQAVRHADEVRTPGAK